MVDKSIYEAGHEARRGQHGEICFGRIVGVNPDSRLCSVKTFFSTHKSVNQQHIDACQWLNMDSNPEGDESTSVPRKGSICMVFYVEGEPYVFGFQKALNADSQALTGKEVTKLTEGDKVFSTQAGNYITIKANGSIEIKSKETLRTLYFPTGSLLQHLTRSYELRTDGGQIDWKFDKTGSTLYRALYRNGQASTAFVLEERGNSDGGVYRTAVGPGTGGFGNIFVYEQTVGIDGTVTTSVGPPGVAVYTETIGPDGSFSRKNAIYSMSVSAAGEMEIDLGPTVTIAAKPDGTLSATTPTVLANFSSSGDFQVQCAGKGDIQFGGEVDITAVGDVKLVTLGGCTLSAAGGIKLDGIGGQGAGAMFGVLSFPNVIDPLTGAPLGPGSTTVTVSI